jgi:glutaredoxin-like protein NrdH
MTVEVYSKPECQPCRLTKKVLDDEGIAYEDRDALEYREYLEGLGHLSAPVVVVGDDHWAGFKPDRLRGLRMVA